MHVRALPPTEWSRLDKFCEERPFERITLRMFAAAPAAVTSIVVAEERGSITTVALRTDRGVVAVNGIEHLAEVLAVAVGGTTVCALLGTPDEVSLARTVLDLDLRKPTIDRDELVMGAIIGDQTVAYAAPARDVRLARLADLVRLVSIRVAYWTETFGIAVHEGSAAHANAEVTAQITRGGLWIVEEAGTITATLLVQAAFPDSILLGSAYVNPAVRNRGAIRMLASTALADARARGVTHAVYVTTNPATVRASQPLGFAQVGLQRGLVF